jgi:hypothetical protein
MRSIRAMVIGPLLLAGAAPCMGQTVYFRNQSNNGFFAPFTGATAPTIRYGDSGWFGGPGAAPVQVNRFVLGLAVFGNGEVREPGTMDLTFTVNDGDASGLVFGPGTELYRTTITGVALPGVDDVGPNYFDLVIDTPPLTTAGNFNNIGWTVSVSNVNFAGSIGFQCSRSTGQQAGFFTNNASFFDGSQWSLFAFSQDPVTGVANFVMEISFQPPASGGCNLADVCGIGGPPSVPDFLLTGDDFNAFIAAFAAAEPLADVTGIGGPPALPDGLITGDDFNAFIAAFAQGCP